MRIAVADIGGTNARFAHAQIEANTVVELSEPMVLATADFPDLPSAFRAFLKDGKDHPQGAAFALAGPVSQSAFKLTNAHWTFDPATLPRALGIEKLILLNDFAAVAHSIAGDCAGAYCKHVAGPESSPWKSGTTTVIGPGTGLGIAHFRMHEGKALIQATEGAHIDFAPLDEVDDAILAALRDEFGRVSVERVISGAGIAAIYAALCQIEGTRPELSDPLGIWRAGIDQTAADRVAVCAVARFVTTLGRIAGDYALAHGASRVVLAGGIGLRLRDHFSDPAFHEAFINKGRYRAMMEAICVQLVVHPQPGLMGAAAAFAQTHQV